MWPRQRLTGLAVLAILWLAFVVFDLVEGWRGYFVAIGAVLAFSALFVIPGKPRL
jgi:hypothetical protein